MKTAIIILAVILGIGILAGGIIGIRACSIADKVTNPDRVIYTYEWFFNTRASIQSYESQLQVASESVETFKADHVDLSTYANSTELSRLREVERGLNNLLISTVNSYNANAKNITRTIFKDWRLPEQMEIKDKKVIEYY